MRIKVDLSPDKMRAYVEVISEGGNDESIEKDLILAHLREEGIVYGLKDLPEVIKVGKRYLVAEGKYPIPGKDASFEILHNVDREIRPKILKDGRVDYRELDVVVVVKKGDPVARRIPPTQGVPGKNVKGEEIPAKPGKDQVLPLGLNVEPSPEDKNVIISKVDGQLIEEDGKVSVFPIYEIKGDLDFSIGNIKFPGSVIVRRNIKPGFKVEAKGRVEVYESAEECDIITDGSIIIRKSYIGKDKAYLEAGEDVIIGFIDSARINAGRDVVSNSAIMHSKIVAGRDVRVESKGIIVGGKVSAKKSIKAKMVGSKFGTSTILEIRKPKGIEDKIKILKHKIEESESLIKHIEEKLKASNPNFDFEKVKLLIMKDKLNLPMTQKIIFNKLLDTYNLLNEEIKEKKEEISRLNKMYEEFKKGLIIIEGIVFPGVTIFFGDLFYKVKDTLKFVKFYFDNGEIKVSSS